MSTLRDGTRCCGQCHAAVGGCLYGVRWTTARTIFSPTKRVVPAGTTMENPVGTPPAVWRDGKWERE